MKTILEAVPHRPGALELVERKGIGHPDTICDAIAEEISIALSRAYLERFGAVLHHNVDKVLLRGGAARPAFGGGEVVEPIEVYVAGRATRRVGGEEIPVTEIVVETARGWLDTHLPHLDVARHVRVHDLVRAGSVDLVGLFDRQRKGEVPLANDTSAGAGFAPHTSLEALLLELDWRIAAEERHPAWGEDVKLMGVRCADEVELTVACAQVDTHLESAAAYNDAIEALRDLAASAARALGTPPRRVHVNTGDDAERGQLYLTVTGTSAESGDDGEVGRGNRVGGLITPHRPMTMEAAAGKNAISHVGKLYNILAREAAQALVANPGIASAQVFLVSQIGRPIDEPQAAHVQLELAAGARLEDVRAGVEGLLAQQLGRASGLWRGVLERAFPLY